MSKIKIRYPVATLLIVLIMSSMFILIANAQSDTTMEDLIGPNRIVPLPPLNPSHIPLAAPDSGSSVSEPVTVYPTPTPTRTPTLSEKFSNSNLLFPSEPGPVITPSQSLFSNRISRISQSPADIPSESESSTLCLNWILKRIQALKDRAPL